MGRERDAKRATLMMKIREEIIFTLKGRESERERKRRVRKRRRREREKYMTIQSID